MTPGIIMPPSDLIRWRHFADDNIYFLNFLTLYKVMHKNMVDFVRDPEKFTLSRIEYHIPLTNPLFKGGQVTLHVWQSSTVFIVE